MLIYLFLLQLIATFREWKGKIACCSIGKTVRNKNSNQGEIVYVSQEHCFLKPFWCTISMHIFTFKRTCVCSLLFQVWISSFLGVPMQTVVAWDTACRTPEFLLFHFRNFYNSFFNSLFTSPIVSLWGRKIRQCLSWLTAQYEQWRDSFPTIQSLKSVIPRSES